MLKRVKQLMLVALCCVSCAPTPKQPPAKTERWVVYYGNKEPAKSFLPYDIVVFDREYHPPLAPLLEDKGRMVLAYISAGEIHGHRKKDIAELREHKALLKANKTWNSEVVDLTSSTWRSMVLDEVADARKQGFRGVMLDTLEAPMAAAQELSPELGRANREAAIQLIADIRAAYPDMAIMLNRAFSLLPAVSSQLDFILAESILAETNVSTGQSRLFPPNTYRQVAGLLREARSESPQLKIVTLDYWKLNDVDGIRRLYAQHRANGFVPYVTSSDLRTHSPEPHSKHRHERADRQPVREDNDA